MLSFVALSSEVAYYVSIEWQARDTMPPRNLQKKKSVECYIYTISCTCRGYTATHTFQIYQSGFNPSASMSWRDRCANRRVRIHQADERGGMRWSKMPTSKHILYVTYQTITHPIYLNWNVLCEHFIYILYGIAEWL